MGQSYLIEGFNRADVAALLALRGYRRAKARAEAWELLASMEATYREIRLAAQPKPEGKLNKTAPAAASAPAPRRIIQDID